MHSLILYKNKLSNVTVKIITDKVETYNLECAEEQFQKFDFNILSTVDKLVIEVRCDNNYCLVADRMLAAGTEAKQYSRAAGEIVTDTVKISNSGLELDSNNDNTKIVENSGEIKIINKLNNNITTTINKDVSSFENMVAKNKFNIGKLRNTVLDDGTIIGSWDD